VTRSDIQPPAITVTQAPARPASPGTFSSPRGVTRPHRWGSPA
jgi:hypothetical protein